jgi:hypothetical protein
MLNTVYQDGLKQAMLFFPVSDSRHIQGVALYHGEAFWEGCLLLTC